jgi:RNA polymerase sigma-70 factor (ECF subfamily)
MTLPFFFGGPSGSPPSNGGEVPRRAPRARDTLEQHAQIPDDDLEEQIRFGNVSAFETFHRRWYTTVWRVAFSYTHTRDAADELVQDAFVRLWERREQLAPGSSLLAYLYRLLRNAAIDRHRHLRVVRSVEDAPEITNAVPGMGEPSLDPEAEAEFADIQARLATAVAALPEHRRMALLLRWQHEMSYDEIAKTLHVTPAAARQLVSRAREMVRTVLGERGS